MTTTQRITLRLSEVRSRLNTIAGLEGDSLTDEVRAESDKLQGEYKDLETRHRAAIVSEGEPVETRSNDTGEGREMRELVSKAEHFRHLRSRPEAAHKQPGPRPSFRRN